jgi:hypothetical protein
VAGMAQREREKPRANQGYFNGGINQVNRQDYATRRVDYVDGCQPGSCADRENRKLDRLGFSESSREQRYCDGRYKQAHSHQEPMIALQPRGRIVGFLSRHHFERADANDRPDAGGAIIDALEPAQSREQSAIIARLSRVHTLNPEKRRRYGLALL